jgi:hypothetical protein
MHATRAETHAPNTIQTRNRHVYRSVTAGGLYGLQRVAGLITCTCQITHVHVSEAVLTLACTTR